jgi:hypothetical protein
VVRAKYSIAKETLTPMRQISSAGLLGIRSRKTAAPLTGGGRLLSPSRPTPRLLGLSRGRGRPLDPNRLGHLTPGQILLTLKSAQVDARNRERTVIEELAHRLDRLASIPPPSTAPSASTTARSSC